MPLSLVLIGFFFMITRQNVISQIVGLLTLENGVFVATVAIAPGLPFAIGFLLLLDLLPAVLFYGVFARLIAARAKTTSIEDMTVRAADGGVAGDHARAAAGGGRGRGS